jgi:hypothetical protein
VGTVSTPGNIDLPPLVSSLAYPDSTAAAGLQVGPGTVRLGLSPAGGDSSTVAEFAGVALGERDRTFVVAAGKLDPATAEEPLQLIIIDARPAPLVGSWTAVTVDAE